MLTNNLRTVAIVGLTTDPAIFAAALKKLKHGQEQFAVEMGNELKPVLRQRYLHACHAYEPRSAADALKRSKQFWSLYEMVNRVLDPLDPVYSIVNAGATLSTTADLLSCQAAAAGQGRILEIIIGGEATVSAVNRIAVQRSGTAFTANTPITPEKFNSRSTAAGGVYGKACTQALAGSPMLSLAFNAFGGFVRWLAAPGEEMYFVNSEIISLRSASGTSVVSGTVIFEEL